VRFVDLELQQSRKDDFRRWALATEPGIADCKKGRKMISRMSSRRWRLWWRIRGKGIDGAERVGVEELVAG